METKQNVKQAQYFHVTLKGSPYEAGRTQGEALRAAPGWVQFLASGKGAFSADAYQNVRRLYETYLPGINEKIQGMADITGIQPEDIVYYASTYLRASGCSHFVILPNASEDGHVLVGRTYDFNDQTNDNRLVTTRIDGKYASIGSSIMLFGRSEGMNEHGLSVTTSSGGLPVGTVRPPLQDGFQFWALTRTLLDRCRDVSEALSLIQVIPMACNPVYLLADRSGRAALVEIYGERKAVRVIEAGSEVPFLSATNHYNLPGMDSIEPRNMQHSLVRKALIDKYLLNKAPRITRQDIQNLIETPYPHGLCCHAYEEYFGMLHAALFDLTTGEAQVCFGSAARNPWHSFTLQGDGMPKRFVAELPMENAPADFW